MPIFKLKIFTAERHNMNILVIGQGGREHALVRALNASEAVKKTGGVVHAVPGSAGMTHEARCHDILWQDFDRLRDLIFKENIELVVIGPEIPLVEGLADRLRASGISVFGPNADGARLEGSKIYSKEFMVEAGVHTARFQIVDSVHSTQEAVANFSPPYVLKADGLAAGKGVFICKDFEELMVAAQDLFEKRTLGEAGACALLEEFQDGYEISYLILTNTQDFVPLVLAQDHKRLCENDRGPNTGGMGAVAPVQITNELKNQINNDIIAPILQAMQKIDFVYRGVLYIGLMITSNGPSVLEFNVRFGDPEAQVILPLLNGDWAQVFLDVAKGRLPALTWKKQFCSCVVLAAEGYPDHPVKDVPIDGLTVGGSGRSTGGENTTGGETDGSMSDVTTSGAVVGSLDNPSIKAQYESDSLSDGSLSEFAYILHAGTSHQSGKGFVTSGGRVLNAIGMGATLNEALERAYRITDSVKWPGMQFRRDIGLNSRNEI
jgi:phosphoribosylamine--glycine ligase